MGYLKKSLVELIIIFSAIIIICLLHVSDVSLVVYVPCDTFILRLSRPLTYIFLNIFL